MNPLRLLGLVLPLAIGCAGAAPAARTPETPSDARSDRADPPAGAAPAEAKIEIPPPPESCAAHASATPQPKSCAGVTQKLADALGAPEATRDAALVELEGCSELPAGVVRALRIELLPTECGDVLVKSWKASGQRAEISDALRGLALAAQASRLVKNPPRLDPPFSKDRVVSFVKGELADWIGDQAAAVYHVSLKGSALSGYGKAVVAVEAGLADMRFVEVVRSAPVPDEIRADPALAEAYYASLDEALEPRKARGRDAALVGLTRLAELGVLHDPRVDRARSLLSQVFSGKRIDALDSLLLPELPAAKPVTPEEQLAARLPTFYVPWVLPKLDATRAPSLRALLERGIPASARAQLDAGKLPPETERLHARALFELGRTYWRAADFARARDIARRTANAGPDMPLVAALGELLAQGPKNAAAMIVGGPHLPAAVGKVEPLDQVGKAHRSLEGHAAFDAALLLELARPAKTDAKYFTDIAARYAVAEKKLPPEHRQRAAERRKGAAETAQAMAKAAQ